MMKKCKDCSNLEELDFESEKGEELKGSDYECYECGAEYHQEYERDIWAKNDQALFNHPKLKMI